MPRSREMLESLGSDKKLEVTVSSWSRASVLFTSVASSVKCFAFICEYCCCCDAERLSSRVKEHTGITTGRTAEQGVPRRTTHMMHTTASKASRDSRTQSWLAHAVCCCSLAVLISIWVSSKRRFFYYLKVMFSFALVCLCVCHLRPTSSRIMQ